MSAALISAINRCADERGDDAKNRAVLIEECSRLPPYGQAEMREHFDAEADRWERANRGEAPV